MEEDHPGKVGGERGGGEQLGELKLRQPLPLDAATITFIVLYILSGSHVDQRVPPQLLRPRPLCVQLLLKGTCKL